MKSIEDVWYNQKRFFRFSGIELSGLFYTAIVLGFIMTFRMWGTGDRPDFGLGIVNLAFYAFIILLILFGRESVRKLLCINSGIKSEFKFWTYGSIFAVVVAVLTNGFFTIYWAGNALYDLIEFQRLGRFRYGLTTIVRSLMAFAAITYNFVLALVLKLIKTSFAINNPILDQFIIFNLIMGACCFIPLPRLDGMEILFRHRMMWFALLGFYACMAAGIWFLNNVFLIALISAVGAGIGFIGFFVASDRHYWDDING